jgi:hypothetical protein
MGTPSYQNKLHYPDHDSHVGQVPDTLAVKELRLSNFSTFRTLCPAFGGL